MPAICKRFALFLGAFLSITVLSTAPAAAQATKTWISGVGDDVNPCSRTAPCKTFSGAISKTAAGGEINCIDPGNYGTVTITKSITIDCSDVTAGILVAGISGIIINTPNDLASRVILRGLIIDGGPPGSASLSGVRVVLAGTVIIDDVRIWNFSGGPGRGITIDGASAMNTQVFVINSLIDNNSGGGIAVAPGFDSTINLVVDNTRILKNGVAGITVNGSGTPNATLSLKVVNSTVAGANDPTVSGIIAKMPTGAFSGTITNSTIADNGGYGIRITGGALNVGTTTIASNGTGVDVGGGAIRSFGNNMMSNNGVNGSFTAVIPTN